MATLASIKKQIETLTKKAEAIRKTEVAAAIKTIRDLVSQFGLTAQDVGLASGRGRGKVKAVSAPKAVGVPKYRDPKTGKTWTGHGKPPGWIADAADRTKFLIDGQGTATTAAPKAAKAPRGATAVKAVEAIAVKAAAPAKKATAKKVTAEKAQVVKQATRAPKAAAKSAAPAKKASAAPKAGKPAAKKAVPAKVQDTAADAATPVEAA